MIDRRAQRDNSISIFRIIAVVCADSDSAAKVVDQYA